MARNYSDKDKPSWVRPEVKAYEKRLELVEDIVQGTSRMHERSADYIRRWKDEDVSVYDIRRKVEDVDPATELTLTAGVGMLHSQPPRVEWGPRESEFKPHWDDIDGEGTKGDVACKHFSDKTIKTGLGLILVDHPPPPVNEAGEPILVTAENEVELGLRPTWAFYARQSLINWRHATIRGVRTLTMAVLHESGEESDGDFGVDDVERYRVLRLEAVPTESGPVFGATWTLHREEEGEDGELVYPVEASGVFRNRAGQIAPFIPLAEAYGGRKVAPMVSTLPLERTAWANLHHWRKASNLSFYEEVAAFPQPYLKGAIEEEVRGSKRLPGKFKVGPMVLVRLKEGGEFGWRELEGKSMEQLRRSITQKEQQMARSGLSFLNPETRRQVTAESKRIDAAAQNATLATAATGTEDAINMAWEYHAWYVGAEKADAPTVTLNRDFESTEMDAQTMRAWAELHEKADIPIRELLEALQAGGRIAPERDLDKMEIEILAAGMARSELDEAEAAAEADEAA